MNQVQTTTPDLSVVIAVVSDAKHLEGCLNALLASKGSVSMEVIVPHVADEAGMQELRSRFPDVQFLPVEKFRLSIAEDNSSREHHDQLRAFGLGKARGRLVALLEDHGRVNPAWPSQMLEAHHGANVGVGGAIENEVDHPLNWAIYFCDFGRYQRPFSAAPSFYISDANSSYKRDALERIQDVWKESFHETTVNSTLIARGGTLLLSPEPVVYQHRENLNLAGALRERYVWGRSFAGTRAQQIGFPKRLVYMALSPALAVLLVGRKIRAILAKKQHTGAFLKAFPLTVLLLTFWSFGEFVGYLTGRANAGRKTPAEQNLAMGASRSK